MDLNGFKCKKSNESNPTVISVPGRAAFRWVSTMTNF